MDKGDLLQNFDFDDSGKNDCRHCKKYFLFPIGCMYGEEKKDY